MVENYTAPEDIRSLSGAELANLQKMAAVILPRGGFDYISGGAGDEITLRRNTEAFNNVDIYPRILKGVDKPDIKTQILGSEISLPFIMAPCAAHGLAHISGENGTAKGVAAAGSIMCISNYAGKPLEEIARSGNGAPQWFQLYLSKDEGFNRYIVSKAESLGVKAIVFTADAPVSGNREADVRNNFVFPLAMPNMETKYAAGGQSVDTVFAEAQNRLSPDDIAKIKSYTKLPVIVKGVQNADDADSAIAAGAAAVWVSNHGGRQLDGGPASFEVLKEISVRTDRRVPVIFDSGIRRGQHIFKALAAGADIAAVGRPALYGLALGGWQGVQSIFNHLAKELVMVMHLAGTRNIEQIRQTRLRCRS